MPNKRRTAGCVPCCAHGLAALDAATRLVVAALLAYLNHRFVRPPTTIGVMVIVLGRSGDTGVDASASDTP